MDYSSSHNHGSGEWVPSLTSFLYNGAIFHFHDYRRTGNFHDPKKIKKDMDVSENGGVFPPNHPF